VNANAVWERQGKGGVNVLLCQALSLMTQREWCERGEGGRETLELCPLDDQALNRLAIASKSL
jgi:hypothetical protein